MDTPAPTLFRFAADGVEFEFAGTPEFVEQQLRRFQRFLSAAVESAAAGGAVALASGSGAAGSAASGSGPWGSTAPGVRAPGVRAPGVRAPGGGATAASAAADVGTASASGASIPTKEGLDSFYAARPLREGRGAIQDRILLFIHYLQTAQGKREVSGDDILWCFQQLGLEQPKNLHNALGILKRKLGHLAEGSRRGLYQLSPDGRQYVEGRFS